MHWAPAFKNHEDSLEIVPSHWESQKIIRKPLGTSPWESPRCIGNCPPQPLGLQEIHWTTMSPRHWESTMFTKNSPRIPLAIAPIHLEVRIENHYEELDIAPSHWEARKVTGKHWAPAIGNHSNVFEFVLSHWESRKIIEDYSVPAIGNH